MLKKLGSESMDNFKVIYKILRSLEAALDYEDFDIDEISHEKLKITYNRWVSILIMLFENGYITGINVRNVLGSKQPQIKINNIKITLKGLEYLQENSILKKAGEIIKGIADIAT
ncbi:MAG: YjcQ family protein [Clostridia bacterium]|nr:YjcQ family protein [Clostridia bacterium]